MPTITPIASSNRITGATIYTAGYIRPANKCGCGLVLEAKAAGFRLTREIGQQINQASAIQADLQAVIAGLSSLTHRKLPVKLITNSPAICKLLERADDTYVTPIKNNEQLSRRLRKLAEGYPQLTIQLDKEDPQIQKAQELARTAASHGHTDTNTQYTLHGGR